MSLSSPLRRRRRSVRRLAVLSLGFVLAAALSPAVASADAGIGELDGVIRDQQGNSVISGARVRLLDPSDGEVVDQTTTTSSGRYALAAPTGVYNLDVTSAPATSRFVAKVRQVEVRAATELNVTVSRLVRFSGRVRDAVGTPLPGVAVQTSLGATVSETDGTFEIFGPAGTHWVRLSRNFDQWGVRSVSVLINDVDFATDRAADLTFPIGSTKVVVRDDSGRPVAGATASLSTYETCPDGCPIDVDVMPGETHTSTHSNVEGVTNDNGEIEFPTLPTRNLMLSASPPEGVPLGIVQRTGITVPPAQPLQAVLRPTVTLQGRLTFAFDEGVSEGKLTLENDEYRSTEGEFGEDGSFAVTAPPGRYRLHVAADIGSYEEQQGMESWAFATGAFVTIPDFDLPGDRRQDLHLPTSAHTIRVLNQAGNPVPATVSGCSGFTPDRFCGWSAGRFQPEGAARVELFPGGVGTGLLLNNGWTRENGDGDTWTVFDGAPLFVSANSGLLGGVVKVDAAGASTEVRLPATVRVTGTAGDARGAFERGGPSEDAFVTVGGSDYGAWIGDGTYQLDVPAGHHTLSFKDVDGYDELEEPTATLPTWWELSVERDITGPTTLNFTVPDTTPAYVTFVDAEGYPKRGDMWLQGSTLKADVPIGDGVVGRAWIGTDMMVPDEHGAFRVPLFGPSELSGFQFDHQPGGPWGESHGVGLRLSPGEHLVIATGARMASADPSAVRDVTVTTYGTMLMPQWVVPEEDGGGTLTFVVTVTDPAGETRQLTTPWNIVTFSSLKPNTRYTVAVTAVNTHGRSPAVTVAATTGAAAETPPETPPDPPVGTNPGTGPPTVPTGPAPGHPGPSAPATTGVTSTARTGYWALGADGQVYNFGDAPSLGQGGTGAIDLEPTPTGNGYWVLNRNGKIDAFGDATALGNVDLRTLGKGEEPASLSATPGGQGYWVFTNRGRTIAFGDAPFLGDVSDVRLNGPVLASVATPSGKGYYMVASDGGIFAFGDATFAGSMGGQKLNAPVQSLVPDGDGHGYWLVASDGGIFAFDAPFKGSLGSIKLNKPVVGMVRYGDGYLMVGADGGIFNFSTLPFSGSLGDKPPTSPVVAVAALP